MEDIENQKGPGALVVMPLSPGPGLGRHRFKSEHGFLPVNHDLPWLTWVIHTVRGRGLMTP